MKDGDAVRIKFFGSIIDQEQRRSGIFFRHLRLLECSGNIGILVNPEISFSENPAQPFSNNCITAQQTHIDWVSHWVFPS